MKIEKLSSSKITILLLLISILIFSFVMYGVLTHNHMFKFLDMSSLEWFTQQFGHPQRVFRDGIMNCYMTFCATIGDVSAILKITIAFIIILFLFKYRYQAIWVLLVMTTGTWLNTLIKQTVERQRPVTHLAIDSGLSFPSGHSNASTLMFLVIMVVLLPIIKGREIRIFVTIIAVVLWISILFCRLYFHAHYFTDVIGGVSLAVVWFLLFILAYPLFTLWSKKKN